MAILNATKQVNTVANPARHLIFFEGADLAYNYKTNQWTSVPAYNGLGLYGINSETGIIGIVRYSYTQGLRPQ